MAEIKTRPATPEYRDGYDLIFGAKLVPTSDHAVIDGLTVSAESIENGRAVLAEWRKEWVNEDVMADEYHAKTYESAHA